MLCEFVWKDQKNDSPKDQGSDDQKHNKNDTDPNNEYFRYRKEYCRTFLRNFFNRHMDDSWFRQMYSPLEQRNMWKNHASLAIQEANAFLQQLQQDTTLFLKQAQLGHGSNLITNTTPTSHELSFLSRIIQIQDIPPFVNDQALQLALSALLDSTNNSNTTNPPLSIFSSTPNSNSHRNFLHRQAFALTQTPEQCQAILQNLRQRKADHTTTTNFLVPIVVDCTDPYGRLEYDTDGQGKGPPDGSAIPTRKVAVMVGSYHNNSNSRSSSSSSRTTTTQVLSAALSSTQRIPHDKERALKIANLLDVQKQIPVQVSLSTVLSQIPESNDDETVLDVCIAYLRRVHLFCFYNHNPAVKTLGDVLAGNTSIHLRLESADRVLEEAAANNVIVEPTPPPQDEEEEKDSTEATDTPNPPSPPPPPAVSKDLLVQRLDDSLQEAIEKLEEWKSSNCESENETCCIVISKEINALADEIVVKESEVEPVWIANHSLDDEGRARCSFHFCRKLFKDQSFLRKHLRKKHGEYLVAEQAAVHDSYMMQAWEQARERPVPKVRVDCGASLGLVEASWTTADSKDDEEGGDGGVIPVVEDPEPALWEKEEERRNRENEMRQRREEVRRGRQQEAENRNFVDVDDMKEEKVEVNFDNLKVPLTKKKKKRKLL